MLSKYVKFLFQLSKNFPEYMYIVQLTQFILGNCSVIKNCSFPNTCIETHVHICDFHREKAWNEWVSKSSNGVSERKDIVLQYLRNIAKSSNQNDLQQNIIMLKESQVWKESVPLQKYYTEFWGLHLKVL